MGYWQFYMADWVGMSFADQKKKENYGPAIAILIGINLCAIGGTMIVMGVVLLYGKTIHNLMAKRVAKSPVTFFDANPSGRVVNRFSKDTAVLDLQMTTMIFFFILIFFQVLMTVTVSIIVLPFMAIILIIMIVGMVVLKRRAAPVTNEALKWDGITRSPMNSLFASTLRGLITIRAYARQKHFINSFY